jgi:hypothetical protein
MKVLQILLHLNGPTIYRRFRKKQCKFYRYIFYVFLGVVLMYAAAISPIADFKHPLLPIYPLFSSTVFVFFCPRFLIDMYPCCSYLEHRAPVKPFVSIQYFNPRQSVGFLERGSSSSQGGYLHTEQHKHRIIPDKHSCLEFDSNTRSQRSSE